jgi:hypothetical protein
MRRRLPLLSILIGLPALLVLAALALVGAVVSGVLSLLWALFKFAAFVLLPITLLGYLILRFFAQPQPAFED